MTRLGTGVISRETHIRDWVRRKVGEIDHELRVARIAGALFDLTRGWHGLGAGDRRMLVLGALVHDVGRSVEDKGHAKHGAKMLMETVGLPIEADERRVLAYLTRYHRGDVPGVGEDSILDKDDDAGVVRVMTGILRAADSLDKRSMHGTRLSIRARGRTVMVRGFAVDPMEAAAELGRRKKLRMMEEELGCEVRVEWYGRAAARMVA